MSYVGQASRFHICVTYHCQIAVGTRRAGLPYSEMSVEQASAFFSSGEEVIKNSIDVHPDQSFTHSSCELDAYYEIERTAEEIIKGDYKRVRYRFF